MRYYPLSEQMLALKKEYQEKGLLLKGKGRSWERDITIKKSVYMFGLSWATHGGWDTFTATGWVHTNYLSFAKARVLHPDDKVLITCWNIVVGPLFFQFAKMKNPCN